MDIEARKKRLMEEHEAFCNTNIVFAAACDRHINIIAGQEMEIETLKAEHHDACVELDDLNACSADDLCNCKDCRIERLSREVLALEVKVSQLEADTQKSEGCSGDDGCSCSDCIIAGQLEAIQSLKLQLCGVQRERDKDARIINEHHTRYEALLAKYSKVNEMLENIQVYLR